MRCQKLCNPSSLSRWCYNWCFTSTTCLGSRSATRQYPRAAAPPKSTGNHALYRAAGRGGEAARRGRHGCVGTRGPPCHGSPRRRGTPVCAGGVYNEGGAPLATSTVRPRVPERYRERHWGGGGAPLAPHRDGRGDQNDGGKRAVLIAL